MFRMVNRLTTLTCRTAPIVVDGAELALRNWLAPGRYRQGDRLPPEHEVATMLGVSRGTLRSALRRLEETGEIVRRQGSGTFVGRVTMPTAFDERLERLEPYSSVAARRGVSLARSITRMRLEPSAQMSRGAGTRSERQRDDHDPDAAGRRRAGSRHVRRCPSRDRPA